MIYPIREQQDITIVPNQQICCAVKNTVLRAKSLTTLQKLVLFLTGNYCPEVVPFSDNYLEMCNEFEGWQILTTRNG